MKKRLVITAALICLLVAAIALALGRSGDRLRTGARKDWKANAIAEIARRSGDTNWLANEVRRLRTEMAKPEPGSGDWISQQLMLMKNDEWMVFTNKCRKADNRIHDIFVGRGSNGRWYYSTYHFCIGMVGVIVDEQPENLTGLVQRYFLVEFDGCSDECLQLTWPPKRE